MSKLDHIQNIYFIGIGGIGMSALARYFNSLGKNVAGYDRKKSGLTHKLEEEGIKVLLDEKVEALPLEFIEDKNALIVYTPAVPESHTQYNYFVSKGYRVEKRAAALGMVTENTYTLAVAGTHGKTTTTAILAHLLKETGVEVTAFLGGISENIQSNLLLAGNKVMVVEADEFDRSFLKLSPNMAAITSMDADHLDIYGAEEEMQETFKSFAGLLPKDGRLFYKKGLPLKGTSLGIEDGADITAENVRVENGSYLFDLDMQGEKFTGFRFSLPGKHNLLNAVTALAMAVTYGAPASLLPKALDSFKGVTRRFTYKIRTEDCVLIDDYAHHPTEIEAVHQAVREMHPGQEVLVVFQPHLFSRTKDFADDFASSLDLFDQIILLDIYPAREKPLENISSEWLMGKIKNLNKQLVQKEELPKRVIDAGVPVVVLLGAGDIGEEVENVKNALLDEN